MPPRKSAVTAKKISGIVKQNANYVPLPTHFESKGDRKVKSAVENRVNRRNQLLRDVLAPSFGQEEEDEDEDMELMDDESMPAFADDISDQSEPEHSEKEIEDLIDDSKFDEEDEEQNEDEEPEEEEEELDLTSTDKEFTLPSELQSQIQSLSEHLDQPHDFIGSSASLQNHLQTLCKSFYDYSKTVELNAMTSTSPLKELAVEGFDYEQIWEELQLQNIPAIKFLDRKMKELEKQNIDFNLSDLEENEDEAENEDDEGFQDEDQVEDENDENDEDLDEEAAGITGDQFFDPEAMEQFLDEAEEDEENENQDEKDLDELDDEDMEGLDTEDAKYSDFFSSKAAKKRSADHDEFDVDVLEDLDEEEENEDEQQEYLNSKTDENGQTLPQLKERLQKLEANKDSNNLSSYEKKISKIQEQINKLEDLIVAEKPWVLKGEVSAKYRPKDSLLDVALDFEQGSKPAPIVTQEVTSNIEEMIKKRIKDSSFDDVIRKKQDVVKVKKVVELDMKKSKVGLAEIYEKEFMKEAYGIDEEKDKLTDEHKIVFNLFKRVNYHLDRLANFHFTPKPDMEIQKKTNVASVQMEEALPTLVSESSTLAPEEVFAKPRDLKGDAEMTSDDRKRKRKGVKEAKKKHKIEKEAVEKAKKRENPNMKTSRAKAEEKLMKERDRNTIIANNNSSGPTSSSELFKQLQSEIRGDISKHKKQQTPEKSDSGRKASNFKL